MLSTNLIYFNRFRMRRERIWCDVILKKGHFNLNFFILSYEGTLALKSLAARIIRAGKRSFSERLIRFLFFQMRLYFFEKFSLFLKFFQFFYSFRINFGFFSWRVGRHHYQIPFVKSSFFEVVNSMRIIYKVILAKFLTIPNLHIRFRYAFEVFFSEGGLALFQSIYATTFENILENLFFLRYAKRFRRSYRFLYLKEV